VATKAEVSGLYKSVLGRDPHASELAPGGWVDKYVSGGKSVSQLRGVFQASSEARSRAGGGYGSSSGYGGNADLAAFAEQQRKATEEFLARQKGEEEGLFGQYEGKIAGQEKMSDLYARLKGEKGVSGLEGQVEAFKSQIFKTRDLLDRLDEDITERTKGKFMSEAQRRRQVAFEEEPLMTQLGRLGTGMQPITERLTAAMSEIGTQMGLTKEDQDKALRGIETRIMAMSDRFAREMTGFTADRELQLTSILDKIQRGRELADRDWQLAQDLAKEERDFAKQKTLSAMSQAKAAAGTKELMTYIEELLRQGQDLVETPAGSSGSGKSAQDLFGLEGIRPQTGFRDIFGGSFKLPSGFATTR